MQSSDAIFEEKYVDNDNDTITLYFKAPVSLLKEFIPKQEYPEAISAEISIEFPDGCVNAEYASACMSPSKKALGGVEDYDWNDIELPNDVITELIAEADKYAKY